MGLFAQPASRFVPDATFSNDGRYRYDLTRNVDLTRGSLPTGHDALGSVLWVMLNPSIADAKRNDPTIKKCLGFAERWGARAIVVVNLFALVSTDPRGLLTTPDPVGPENDNYIRAWAAHAERVVLAYGDSFPFGAKKLPESLRHRDRDVIALLGARELFCLGTTKGGVPRHPSRLGYHEPLVPFAP